MKLALKSLTVLYVFAILLFLSHLYITKTAIYGDGRFYYSYLPSIIIDHSLNLSKSFTYFGITNTPQSLIGPGNIYPIGSAIVWTPPFIIAQIILLPFHLSNGFNLLYQILIGIWNISFVFMGLFLLFKTLLRFFDEKISLLATIGTFTSTNLFFYGSLDVINSHSASFFFSAALIYLFTSKRTILNAVLIGIAVGMLALIRSQDYLFIVFPFLDLLINKKIKYSSISIVFALIIFFPQIFLWHSYWGSFFGNPYLKVQAFDFLHPQIIGVLFNKDSGIIWTPIVFISIFGLIKLYKKNKTLSAYSLFFILTQIYLISSWSVWWEGASYSARMLVSSLPFMGFGLAYILSMLKKYKEIIITLFSILNFILIVIFLSTY